MAKERLPSQAGNEASRTKFSGRRKGTTIRSPEHQLLVDELVAARKAAGLTQEELARKVGKHQSHISRLEAAERDVSVLDLVLWCQATGVKFSDFARLFEKKLEEQKGVGEPSSS